MATQRNNYSPEFKAKVALEALKEQQTLAELGSCYGVHPTLVAQWKRQLREGLPQLFADRRQKPDRSAEELQAQLYQQIGQLKVELDWLKKKLAWSVDQKRAAIEPEHPALSVARQCELVGLAHASYYYRPAGESAEDLALLRLLDEQYTRTPFYGVRRMTAVLRQQGYAVNPKRVRRLLRTLGLAALAPQPGTSRAAPGHRVYPYLLRGIAIERVNQVWSTDITYIRLRGGFAYLAAVLDWHSRYVLSWALSNRLEVGFCLEVLEAALAQGQPEIFNTDQGAQFTSPAFTGRLAAAGVRISMDGRGRALDNVFVERLWRSVKYEEVYLQDYGGMGDAQRGLGRYFGFYNEERPHQGLGYRTPLRVYGGG
jgi:putative transposase